MPTSWNKGTFANGSQHWRLLRTFFRRLEIGKEALFTFLIPCVFTVETVVLFSDSEPYKIRDEFM